MNIKQFFKKHGISILIVLGAIAVVVSVSVYAYSKVNRPPLKQEQGTAQVLEGSGK